MATNDGVEEAMGEHYGLAMIEAFEKAWRAAILPTNQPRIGPALVEQPIAGPRRASTPRSR